MEKERAHHQSDHQSRGSHRSLDHVNIRIDKSAQVNRLGREISPLYHHLITLEPKCKMRIHFHTLFLGFAVLYAIGSDWSVPSCIFTICASVFMLADVTPKIWRYFHASKRDS